MLSPIFIVGNCRIRFLLLETGISRSDLPLGGENDSDFLSADRLLEF